MLSIHTYTHVRTVRSYIFYTRVHEGCNFMNEEFKTAEDFSKFLNPLVLPHLKAGYRCQFCGAG